jgi:hypothetical protein
MNELAKYCQGGGLKACPDCPYNSKNMHDLSIMHGSFIMNIPVFDSDGNCVIYYKEKCIGCRIADKR